MKKLRPIEVALAVAALCSSYGATTRAAICGTENLLASRRPIDAKDISGDPALVTDGAVGTEGAIWNAPVVVTLDTPLAQLTYDLGEPREIGALVVQADANDSYKVRGSLDGTPASYQVLAEVANVVGRGHGLRTRAIELSSVRVRYLRFSDPSGDSFYSLSELAAYCKKPTAFPPIMKVADSPVASAVSDPPAVSPRDRARSVLLFVSGVLVIAGLLYRTVTQVGREPLRSGGPAGVTTHNWLRILFLASGSAALIYEVVWFHLLRLVIGASALSVGIVLAAFMGGMFLGSFLFARYVPRSHDPVRVYAFLEVGVGVFGLAMPLLLPAVKSVYIGLFGYGPLGIALRAVVAAVLLLPPTALMGATLPAIARRYSRGRRGMSALAGLYAANTIGAVVGCLLSAFYLLAVWDVWVATASAAVINFIIGAIGLGLARRRAEPSDVEGGVVPLADSQTTQTATREARLIYVAAGLSGLTALGAQVVWTRILTLLFGATVYAFAIILAVFLAGLGIGSALASRWLRRGQNALTGFAWSQIGLVAALLLGGYLLADVLPYASPPAWTPLAAVHALHVVRAVDVILPGAILWGMSFPYALAAAAAGSDDTGKSSGYVYAANTVGAIIGAIGVSFWAIPSYGTHGAQRFLVIGAGLSAAALLIGKGKRSREAPSSVHRRVISPFIPLAACALAAAVLPGLPTKFKAHGRYIWWMQEGDRYPYVSEGAASTVAVHLAPDGYTNFHVSGRVEASNNPNDLRTERLIGHLSGLLHPGPESVLVVGMGAGITAGSLAMYPEVKRVVICEIEPRVVGAARQFSRENYAALDNPKVEVVFDDARHFLATTRERFDVITSDPIHPWVRGNSILFSREYYAIVKDHLKPGGIASQWVPLYETSEEAIQIQLKTFVNAFPDGTVWNTVTGNRGYDVVLVGGNAPLHLDAAAIQARLDASPGIASSLRDVRISGAIDLLATYGASGPDMAAWLDGVPVNRDFSLKLEYVSGLAINSKQEDAIYQHMTAGRSYPASMITASPQVQEELRRRLMAEASP